MDPTIRARRVAIARQQIEQAATALAERHGFDAEIEKLALAKRVPAAVRDVYEMEAAAALLTALVDTDGDGGSQPESEIEAAIGENGARALADAGYNTPEAIRNASDEDLDAVDGIGPVTVAKLREAFGEAQ